MPNIARLMNEEIRRLARREAKTAIAGIRKDNVKLKGTAADLRRRIAQLERDNKRLIAAEKRRQEEVPQLAPEQAQKVRITSKGICSLRKKLGVSQAGFAELVGASLQSVFGWENKGGALRLRDATKAGILSIRGLGAREAKERLKKMADKGTASKAAKKK